MIRPVRSEDVDELEALYAGLDEDGRYRRFFSVYRPRRQFFERMTAMAGRGGVQLVAVVSGGSDRAERIVGEAGYELRPDGDGELAMTVDSAWRGWLGPYLLDALVEAAAARGVPNLEADVLMTNGPMLALLRSRGHAIRPSGDWTVVHGLIGTTTAVPTWPGGHHGLRLLVEGGSGHWHAEEAAPATGTPRRRPRRRDSKCSVVRGPPVSDRGVQSWRANRARWPSGRTPSSSRTRRTAKPGGR